MAENSLDINGIRDLKTWLEKQNFSRHPFEQLVADNDQDLEKYFQHFPFLEIIKEPKCTFLFLERGAGKSANRVYLHGECDKSLESDEAKLGVPHIDFHRLIHNDRITLADHVEEILREAVPRLYDIIIKSERKSKITGLAYEYRKDFVWFITNYSERLSLRSIEKQIYQFDGLSRAQVANIITRSFTQALDLIKAIIPISGAPAEIALSAIQTLLEIRPEELKDLEKSYRSPLDLMARFAEIAQQFDIHYIYILVDRVDEYAQIHDYARAANMLKALIETIPLLEMPAYAFKFFLPVEMRDELAYHLRSDRFIIHDYTWTQKDLEKLLEERLLSCYSPLSIEGIEDHSFDEKEGRSFVRLFDEEILNRDVDIVAEMIQFARNSPRNLLKLARMIFDEHTRSGQIPLKIPLETYRRVLGKFAAEQLRLRALDEPMVNGLTRLNLSNRSNLAELLGRDLRTRDPDLQIKKWEEQDAFYAPHFSMTDIIQHLNVSRSEARKIANDWEDEGLVSVHYKIRDEHLARYLFTQEREEVEHDG